MGAKVLHVLSDVTFLNRLVERKERSVTNRELRNYFGLLIDLYRSTPTLYAWEDILALVATIHHYLGPEEASRAADLLGLD